ncbi:Retrotransposon Gag-like protein 3 [Naganishia albida]|nr:Retrotransposon Gag-like protein 3 [Naganishia albida]
MFNPFAFFYQLFLFVVRPFFIVPQGTGRNILDDDHPMGDASTSSSAGPAVGFGLPQDNITMQDRITQLEQELRNQRHPSSSFPFATSKEPKINSPAPFKDNKSLSEEFILKCDQVFSVCHRTYHDDDIKLAFVFNLLEGDAYQWIKPALLAKDKPT